MKDPTTTIFSDTTGFSRQSAPAFALEQLAELLERLSPGEQLPSQREIAEVLKISRPSLREAMAVLQAIGLIEIRHGRGAFVSQEPALRTVLRSITSLVLRNITFAELFSARETIELEVVHLAVLNGTQAQFADLRQRAAAMLAIHDLHAFNEADLDFHLAIARTASNSVWVHMLEMVRSLLFRSLLQSDLAAAHGTAGRLKEAAEQHVAIAEAIASGDAEGARAAMQSHLKLQEPFLQHVRDRRITESSKL
jgi:GntR family transcriptional regulator, transcriptional repressor for pyruvate dehydrogenase complex